ncbi:MAG TPA: M48 family metalloprotease [Oxalicibacterium sp.]|nr:M48 family metalloprotease [Oxalicibacterium sp.]
MMAIFTLQAVPSPAQGLPSLGDTEREELSPIMERKLGEQIMHQLRRDRDYMDDAPVQEYLNNLGASLLAVRPDARGEAQYDFFFFAVRDPVLNAFALPGGFIGVHSGLILAAQSESELASVMSHEIGHVAQRHIARMIGKQKQDALIPLASLLLGALAATASPDAGMAVIAGGQGLAIQRQLNFSREAEREADRVGLDIMRDAGFETAGMINFFGRLQKASRGYNDSAPAYLRTHPLTTERIADIEARTRDLRYRQHADSLDFSIVRARVRVLQSPSTQGLIDAEGAFKRQLQQRTRPEVIAANYGLAFVALRQGNAARAQTYIDQARATLKSGAPSKASDPMLASLAIDTRLAAKQYPEAVTEADAARRQFPLSRGIAIQYADALLAAGRHADAASFLRDQVSLYRSEPKLYDRLAKVYAAQNKDALQHMALAEAYALRGGLSAAIDQLGIARRSADATFYDQSIIDARERELKAQRLEELQQEKG